MYDYKFRLWCIIWIYEFLFRVDLLVFIIYYDLGNVELLIYIGIIDFYFDYFKEYFFKFYNYKIVIYNIINYGF